MVDFTQDIIDVRDIITRVEELTDDVQYAWEFENENTDAPDWESLAALRELQGEWDNTDLDELIRLLAILDDLRGNSGDEKFRGEWYPLTLIRDSYFTEYAEEFCSDLDVIPKDLPDYIVIDWDATARNLLQDYTSIDIDGVTYWYR